MTKKKISTDDIVRNLFEPAAGSPAAEIAEQKENVFFVRAETLPPLAPKPKTFLPINRVLVWACLGMFAILTAHFSVSVLEEDSRFHSAQALLQAKKKQGSFLDEKLAQKKSEYVLLKTELAKRRGEKNSVLNKVQFLKKNVGHMPAYTTTLSQLGQILPKGVWLEEIVIDKNKINVQGHSFDRGAVNQYFETFKQKTLLMAPRLVIEPPNPLELGYHTFEIYGYLP